ncbi:DUF4837 family protein [Sediminitomix flava]|uniref:Uncharacterized protein DUF4837 n=1 Tax=Sediminitomix flava TaxID=379075 RepID=A0A315ZVI6_SEDFL|nr:DUF4837 family protein [Sediminitomix flava]PWJ40229.1 uncharacterized protein DUF4837 [Sediminitomix flava]
MKKLMKLFFAFSIIAVTFLSSCNSKKEGKEKVADTTNYALPSANGAIGEIYLLMDSAKWEGELGAEVRKIFNETMPGLLQNETRFNVSYIRPKSFNRVLKRTKNLVFITSLESNSSDTEKLKEFYGKAMQDKFVETGEAYMSAGTDIYARGQKVLNIVSGSDRELMKLLKKNKQSIHKFFADADIARINEKMIFNTHLKNELKKEHGFSLNIPDGYKIAKDTAQFVWLRQPDVKWDKYLIVAYKDYESEKEFDYDSVIHFRDSLCKKFIYGNPAKKDSYVITLKDRFRPDTEVTELDGKFARELRGHWQTYSQTMGGPFVSYTVTDDENKRLYYVEGFVYAPSKDKMPFIRELEAVLTTFETN